MEVVGGEAWVVGERFVLSVGRGCCGEGVDVCRREEGRLRRGCEVKYEGASEVAVEGWRLARGRGWSGSVMVAGGLRPYTWLDGLSGGC